jgi:beta-mannosidase
LIIIAHQEVPYRLPPRGRQTIASDAILDGFHDVGYSYRFGPPIHDLAIATLLDEQRRVLSEAFYFVQRREPSFLPAVQLSAEAELVAEGRYQITLTSDRFLHSVSIDARGFLPSDNYFHLPPGRQKCVCLTAIMDRGSKIRGHIEALNLKNPVAIRVKGNV